MTEEKKDPERIPENEDLLFGGQVKPYEKDEQSVVCCTCTKKRLIIASVVLVMLLLYGLGLAIGLAVGFSKKDEATKKENQQDILEPVGAVVSDHHECSDIGRDILARYGTAVDAAIATLICNGVRTPHSMGIGGGCFMLIYDRHDEKAVYIDGRETVPKFMTEKEYKNMSEYHVEARKIAVPGELKAYKAAHAIYGRLPWKDLFQPTIEMIRQGFPLSEATANALDFLVNVRDYKLVEYPGLCAIFCANVSSGEPKKAGDTIWWPKLADTLQGIAEEGIDYLYNSQLTNTIVEEIKNEGGILDISDFILKYKVKTGSALDVDIHNSTVYTMDEATGGPVIGLVLNILKRYDWSDVSSLEANVDFYHKLIEAMKLGDADKLRLGDPDFDNTTLVLEKMRSEEYADILRTKITERTHDKGYYTDATEINENQFGTSHVSVLSPYGDAVSVTSTVNWYFGSKIVSNATGIIWNNEMDDFDTTVPTTVNRIEAGKRPRSSMAPVIVVDHNGDVKLVTGAAGGSYITTSVAQILAKLFFLQKPLEEVIDSKRFHPTLKENLIYVEKGFPEDIASSLKEDRGHTLKYSLRPVFSVVESISVDNKGTVFGYADKRKSQGKASHMYRNVINKEKS